MRLIYNKYLKVDKVIVILCERLILLLFLLCRTSYAFIHAQVL
jgi:hypothetical protein